MGDTTRQVPALAVCWALLRQGGAYRFELQALGFSLAAATQHCCPVRLAQPGSLICTHHLIPTLYACYWAQEPLHLWQLDAV